MGNGTIPESGDRGKGPARRIVIGRGPGPVYPGEAEPARDGGNPEIPGPEGVRGAPAPGRARAS
jgi:hypothetical protein